MVVSYPLGRYRHGLSVAMFRAALACGFFFFLCACTACAARQLVGGQSFHDAALGSLPASWNITCANPAIRPKFSTAYTPDGARALLAEGNGRKETFGYVHSSTVAELAFNRTYCLTASLSSENLPPPSDLHRHMRVEVFAKSGMKTGIFEYTRHGTERGVVTVSGLSRFSYGGTDPTNAKFGPRPRTNSTATVRLLYKFSAHGRIWFHNVSLSECLSAPPRPPVRVASAWWTESPEGIPCNFNRYWSDWLDEAGSAQVDAIPRSHADGERRELCPKSCPGTAATCTAHRAGGGHASRGSRTSRRRSGRRHTTGGPSDRDQGRLTYSIHQY